VSRPRSFDDHVALEAALASFWGRGFEATSIRDLADAMSISGTSLYNAFGDKRALFRQALEHYCRTRTYPLLARIEAEHPGEAAVPAFFAEIVERSVADRERRGCFLINAALETAPHDSDVAEAVRDHLGAIRTLILRGLKARRRPADATPVEDDADHLIAVLLGVRVMARTRPERRLLARTAHAALRSVGFKASQLGALGQDRAGTRVARALRAKGRNPQSRETGG
jgi:TetR/AcrR family transcriptional repressor of nem operon